MHESKNQTLLYVTCVPNAKRNHAQFSKEGQVKAWVKAPNEKGLANAALIALIADFLDISKSQIKIIKGMTSRKKLLLLYNITPEKINLQRTE